MQFRYKTGDTLKSFLDTALRTTKEYKRITTLGDDFVLGEDGEDGAGMENVPCLFRLVSETEYGEFDPLRARNRKIIRYRIMKYAEPAVIPSTAEYQRFMDTKTGLQEKRIRRLREEGLLRKKYDFMFGETANTDVTSLQFTFDKTYFNISPIGDGTMGNHDMAVAPSSSSGDPLGNLRQIKQDAIKRIEKHREAAKGPAAHASSRNPADDPGLITLELQRVAKAGVGRGEESMALEDRRRHGRTQIRRRIRR